MCGLIAGFRAKGGFRPGDLASALNILAARGPDERGERILADGRVALGHTRLAIVGIADGRQPLHLPERGLWAVVNGEFYDHAAQRRALIREGTRFRTNSDSELLLHRYARHGLDAVHHLRGEFAFVLWDDREQRLIAGRDAFGVKPLLVHEAGGTLTLASNAKALFAMGVPIRWDAEGLKQTLLWQYPAAAETLFEGVRQVPPGHLLVHERGKTEVRAWWDPEAPAPEPAPRDRREQVERFAASLRESVSLRLRGEVPVCCHLSGGLDSSTILALAAEAGEAPACFTVSFEEQDYDEEQLADRSANHFGAPLHRIHLSNADLLDHLEAAVIATEGVAVNGHLPAKYLLNQRIRAAGFKVALSGEGADEVLLGYPHLRLDYCRRRGLDPALLGGNEASRGLMMPHGARLNTDAAQQRLGFVPAWLEAKAGMGKRVQPLLRPPYGAEDGSLARFLTKLPDPRGGEGRDPVERAARLWTQSALPQYILKTLGDGCEAAFGIEGRPPFLDTHLWRVARDLPLDLKIHHDPKRNPALEEKHILRALMHPILPTAITARRKHPFVAPPLLNGSREPWQDRLRDATFAQIPCFEPKAVRALLDAAPTWDPRTRKSYDPLLLTMLSLHALQKHHRPEAP
ncbi:asparagine synthase (glutamine-hydrolyzing) [Acanthopleuribacter pedis]|uniref:asparagine synthase (glutamine-hydrolyzing) n=1 Tax=Acanthopleuribacter pedis TaxID=442870 RepID=A0A8J7QIG8_9BACT|nr:asparagine synthase (glutamine-hydrolyzing) [Acanthopleuribacter pedis]MBO1322995.1 asparagine synthase (glutamine-hydrolyzing) [Acanthopleuribacter pedis]